MGSGASKKISHSDETKSFSEAAAENQLSEKDRQLQLALTVGQGIIDMNRNGNFCTGT